MGPRRTVGVALGEAAVEAQVSGCFDLPSGGSAGCRHGDTPICGVTHGADDCGGRQQLCWAVTDGRSRKDRTTFPVPPRKPMLGSPPTSPAAPCSPTMPPFLSRDLLSFPKGVFQLVNVVVLRTRNMKIFKRPTRDAFCTMAGLVVRISRSNLSSRWMRFRSANEKPMKAGTSCPASPRVMPAEETGCVHCVHGRQHCRRTDQACCTGGLFLAVRASHDVPVPR